MLSLMALSSVAGQVASTGLKSPVEIRSGIWRGALLRYRVENDRAIFQGDIILGRMSEVDPRTGAFRLRGTGLARGGPERQGASIASTSELWPVVNGVARVPYIITSGSANVNTALGQFNSIFTGIIQFTPRNGEANYVNINLNPADTSGACESNVGMSGGEQEMTGAINCAVVTILHEMGHTVGLWHEQSRTDRDSFVTVQYANIDKPWQANFDKVSVDEQDNGGYDYNSIMHYNPYGFSKNGLPTIESIPPGIPLSAAPSYTSEDVDTIRRLYGATPTAITIEGNPSGASVTVDGSPCTTPCTFAWAMNSTHHIDVPSGAQTIASQVYTFGRWSDGQTSGHDITVAPGNGFFTTPSSSPAVTVYTAHFILQQLFSVAVSPAASGTVQLSPSPSTYSGAAGQYYPDRQVVTMTPQPVGSNNFYRWGGGGPEDLFQGDAENPKHLLLYFPANVTAYFTTSPVTIVKASLPLLFPPGQLTVDGNGVYSPEAFSPAFDATWTAGSSHTLAAPSPQSPVTTNVSYAFTGWSGHAESTLNVSAPASGTATYTALFNGSYRALGYTNGPACAGTVSPTDTFLTHGTPQNFTAAPGSGFQFTGWSGDNSTTTNPLSVNASDEVLLTANFNVVASPLSISSLSPATMIANTGPQTLTINGSGFTSDANTTYVFLNGSYVPNTFVNSSQLTVQAPNSAIASAGGVRVDIVNSTGACSVQASGMFKVLEPNAPDLTISKHHSGNFSQGQTEAQYTITVTNSGSATTSGTVQVTDALPTGLTATAISGTGWTCTLGTLTCTRTDGLGAGLSYPNITLTVNVAANASGSVTNLTSVWGGNELVKNNDVATDPTTITSANQPPTAVSVAPSSGTGNPQSFTFTYSDPNGWGDLSSVYVVFNSTVATGQNACYFYYLPASNTFYLKADDGSTNLSALTPGGAGTDSNSQCSIAASGVSVGHSGNNLTLTVGINFNATFTGRKTVYLRAIDQHSASSGFVARGTWSAAANQAPATVSVSPSSGTGSPQSFTFTYSDPNGWTDLGSVYALFNSTVASTVNGCYMYYVPATNYFYLRGDDGATNVLAQIPGGGGTGSNSQCSISATSVSVGHSGNNLTLTVAVSFKSSFTGLKHVYVRAIDNSGTDSKWSGRGTWSGAANQAPTAISAAPASGTANPHTFTFTYADPNGWNDLASVYALLNGSLSTANGCYMYYVPAVNVLYLRADNGVSSLPGLTPGGSGTAANSRCSIAASGISVSHLDTNLIVTVAIDFLGTFTGAEHMYLRAIDNLNADSHFVAEGVWPGLH